MACDSRRFFLSNWLYDAIQEANFRAVKMILTEKMASPNFVIPEKGISPLHLSIGVEPYRFALEATKLLLEYGGNPNVRSEEGLTPLHIAVSLNRLELIQLLLAHGANPLIGDLSYNSPLDYATEDNIDQVLSCIHTSRASKAHELPRTQTIPPTNTVVGEQQMKPMTSRGSVSSSGCSSGVSSIARRRPKAARKRKVNRLKQRLLSTSSTEKAEEDEEEGEESGIASVVTEDSAETSAKSR